MDHTKADLKGGLAVAPTGTSSSDPAGSARRPRPGPAATSQDLWLARYRYLTIRSELPRVRAAAAAWRNGLGVVLAGLLGFSLIRGRSDVTGLSLQAAVAVGFILLLALISGCAGALLLMRASFGRPEITVVRNLLPEAVTEHKEAIDAAGRLRRGITATLFCTGFLISAVALTWYGPPKESAQIQIGLRNGGSSVCGEVAEVAAASVVLETDSGERTVRWDEILAMKTVIACSS